MTVEGKLDVPDKIVNGAHQYAQFHRMGQGMPLSKREIKKLLDYIAPEIIGWSQAPKPTFKKGFKGGIDKGPRDRSKKR